MPQLMAKSLSYSLLWLLQSLLQLITGPADYCSSGSLLQPMPHQMLFHSLLSLLR